MAIVKSIETLNISTAVGKAYGGKYEQPRAIMYMNDDTTANTMYIRVELEGLISLSVNPAVGTVIATIPDALMFPYRTHIFQVVTNGGTVRLDVTADGKITYKGGEIFDYVALDGIGFDIDPA